MIPGDIKLHKKSGQLELVYTDGAYTLSAEFLRVHSPSAEVRGHGVGQEVLQYGKKQVLISNIESVGNYALRLHFDDDHNSGIYTWEYLRELCLQEEALWQKYLNRLQAAGQSREPLPADTQVVTITPLKSD
ncbi:MAG: 1-(5-phosphoribosyl)-5-((5-phosphoribosylamino)methylideneamino)imidazole-4-carboxamide isomerase [Gammaproteobacteria bacterium]|nr:1-(5-phosphoribosyl)-5-((5-phosphoribosylamino)methylideneamino)imidazole-4-carboxamide isomerase [Gammaproteobacteria bacterium]MAY03731.1 1-(5-phosphoribosyl)-5-((5-phosphoribosylamino)methylideneamino)imidazole-4-carboxamide isomerase [Gammaproteobacteria bacterium]|tara:strand:- start:408876 stop:409271 length:396 start_codon:yes stop_codon:yes gene_type:complete